MDRNRLIVNGEQVTYHPIGSELADADVPPSVTSGRIVAVEELDLDIADLRERFHRGLSHD